MSVRVCSAATEETYHV